MLLSRQPRALRAAPTHHHHCPGRPSALAAARVANNSSGLAGAARRRLVSLRFQSDAGAESAAADKIPVLFELAKHCPFGQAFALVGDTPQLGQWDVAQALKLQWSEGDVWRACVELPVDTAVSFKYVQISAADGGLVAWGQDIADGSNLRLLVSGGSSGEDTAAGLQLLLEPADAADTSHLPYLTAQLDTAAVLAPESAAVDLGPEPPAAAPAFATDAEAEPEAAVDSDDDSDLQPQGVLEGDPAAEYTEEAEEEQEEGQMAASIVDQLQLEDAAAAPAAEAEPEQAGPDVAAVAVEAPAAEVTSESVQDQGLQATAEWAGGAAQGETAATGLNNTDPLAAFGGGGMAAGYEDEGSIGAAVGAGLMEAGDDETVAAAAAAEGFTTAPSSVSEAGSTISSHMLTSLDLEVSETDEPDSWQHTAAAAAPPPTEEEQDALEGLLPTTTTPPDSNAAAAAATDRLLGAQVLPVPAADASGLLLGAAAGCRPANPHSKLVTADASISSVDTSAPLLDNVSKPVTELDGNVAGVHLVDSYEDALAPLAAAAAAAAAASSMDGWSASSSPSEEQQQQGREGAAERGMQTMAADGGGLDEGGPDDAADVAAAVVAASDSEATGTWTAEALSAAQHSSEKQQEEGQGEAGGRASASSTDTARHSKPQKPLNWLQRLFGGGGGDEGGGRA